MLLSVISYLALCAQAMTAALAAGRRRMDWFGVCLIACVTALGGGSTRDVLLGHYPIFWVSNPELLPLVCAAALLSIALARVVGRLRWTFLLLDALGLVVFTIVGCEVAIGMGQHPMIVVVAGMITGVVGGILRDVLCNDIPLVLSRELYATVSIVTGIVYFAAPRAGLPHDAAVLLAFAVGFPLRVLALVFDWGMPKFVYKDLR